jgi:hypothetical protein
MQSDKQNLSECRKRNRAPAPRKRKRKRKRDARRPATRAGQRRAHLHRAQARLTRRSPGDDHPATITRRRSPDASQHQVSTKSAPSQHQVRSSQIKSDRRAARDPPGGWSHGPVGQRDTPTGCSVMFWKTGRRRCSGKPGGGDVLENRLFGDVLENRGWEMFDKIGCWAMFDKFQCWRCRANVGAKNFSL